MLEFYRQPSGIGLRPPLVTAAATAALAAMLLVAHAAGPQGPATPGDENSLAEPTTGTRQLREGTRIVDQLGTFKVTGDRATFYANNGEYRLGGLPNLNLERIVRAIRDNPDQLVWSASGFITEYQSANYLLITRAVLKARESPKSTGLADTDGRDHDQP